jgi:hypothetical protein
VAFWIDDQTGLIVKSHATVGSGASGSYYEALYLGVKTSGVEVPEREAGIVSAPSFLAYHQEFTDEHAARGQCGSQAEGDRDLCYKNLATSKRNAGTCGLIGSGTQRENCVMIVAQMTKDAALCAGLSLFADDCYITVAGETGDAELCKLVKDPSLLGNCASAVSEGQRKADEARALAERIDSMRNCAANDGCKAAGKYNEMCNPKNQTPPASGSYSPSMDCFANVTCGCNDGFCGFGKDDAFYKCVADADELVLQEYIKQLMAEANSTNNSSG